MRTGVIKIIQSFVKTIYDNIGKNEPKVKKYMDYIKTNYGAKILTTSWFFTFEKGRGKRKSTQRSQPDETISGQKLSAFEARLYRWMEKRGKLTAKTPKGKINQAKSLRYFINKRGTRLYRSGGKKTVYSNEINEKALNELNEQIGDEAVKIVTEIVDELKNI